MCEWLLSKSLTFVFLLLTQKDEKKKGGRTKKKKEAKSVKLEGVEAGLRIGA